MSTVFVYPLAHQIPRLSVSFFQRNTQHSGFGSVRIVLTRRHLPNPNRCKKCGAKLVDSSAVVFVVRAV